MLIEFPVWSVAIFFELVTAEYHIFELSSVLAA